MAEQAPRPQSGGYGHQRTQCAVDEGGEWGGGGD